MSTDTTKLYLSGGVDFFINRKTCRKISNDIFLSVYLIRKVSKGGN